MYYTVKNNRNGFEVLQHFANYDAALDFYDLREIKTLGWVQQTLYGSGTFFFSGAFWLIIELMAHQEKFAFTPWMGVCIISMAAGVILAAVGLVMFSLRQKRLNKYFVPETTQ